MREEGGGLQSQGRLAEALAKYRESLALFLDPAPTEHVAKVEAQIAADRQRQQ